MKIGILVDHFPIIGKGWWGYIKNVGKLRRYLKVNKYDVVHSHYSLSAMVSSLAGARPHVVSLMGSDIYAVCLMKQAIRVFDRFTWDACIVKSEDNRKKLGLKIISIIPNGVDLELFYPMEKAEARKIVKWEEGKKIILFAADPSRPEKNHPLAMEAMSRLDMPNAELKVVYGVPHSSMNCYLNAADLLLLTSSWEGSPNVVKEAMACNRSVVSTDVGDVRRLFGEEPGYFLSSSHPDQIAANIRTSLSYMGRIHGRKQIQDLGLDDNSVARKLVVLYESVLV